MSDLAATDEIFFNTFDFNKSKVEQMVQDTLVDTDDGELFLEYCQTEGIAFDDGRIKSASFDTTQGFGLRAIVDEATGYSHASELSISAIQRAANAVSAVKKGYVGSGQIAPSRTNNTLYIDENPLNKFGFDRKVNLLTSMNDYARSLDRRVRQVSASIMGNWQALQILRIDGYRAADIRPLVRLNIQLVLEDGTRLESGNHGIGGRVNYDEFFDEATWKNAVDESYRQAQVNLEAVDAPAGEMTVVLGPGWPGILLHEAIGHGLEGDFNRKKTSAFAGLIGEKVAASDVTVVDDGTIENRRGSLSIDDEGTPTEATVLIDKGILVGYMQDRMNARLMKTNSTGNGRRQSFAHAPMPRMTNTFMLAGNKNPKEILTSVKKGLYATSFGGGQVDITNGKFVFSCTEAYLIENGKLTNPVKGATLIGSGPDVLTRVSMVGDDLLLDPGIGTCGKAGQGVPVGVGQPTLRIDGITVGGTSI